MNKIHRFSLVFGFVFVFLIFCFFTAKAAMFDIQNTWSKEGEDSNTELGISVASGDVNGDGYSDIIVGSQYGVADQGRVYIYAGSATGLSTTVLQTLTGAANADFGRSVASGDVNGDNFDDVIVGADRDNGTTGSAYVYLGSASGPSSTAVWSANGEAALDYYGFDVASAGDINGDGYDEVIVGAYENNSGGNDSGEAYVYYGSANGPSVSADWTMDGEGADDYFGRSVSSAGDVNGDGYDDIIIGGDKESSWRGMAYVFYGSAAGLSTTAGGDWSKAGSAASAQFGYSVSSASDVNGDGYDDIIVGSMGYPATYKGTAYAFYGSAAGLSSSADWSQNESTDNYYYGHSVSGAGDVNGDGYDDVIVGADTYGATSTGKIYFYLGGSGGLSTTSGGDWSQEGAGVSYHLGQSVASAGDTNGNGYSEIIAGATEGSVIPNTGHAYVYSNLASFSVSINNGAETTDSRDVVLGLTAYNSSTEMIISENANFSGASWESFTASKSWALSSGDGVKTVYARFKDAGGVQSKIVGDSITLDTAVSEEENNLEEGERIILKPELDGQTLTGQSLIIYFKKLPNKLTKNSKYWMKWKKFTKYPKKWTIKKTTSLKRYWKLTTNLNKYKIKKKSQKFKIKVTFKYSKKLFSRLKKKNSVVKKRDIYLKYKTERGKKWKLLTEHWKKAKILHKKSKNRFVVKYFGKFKQKKYFFAIGLN